MAWKWRTLEDGTVETDRGQGFGTDVFGPADYPSAKTLGWKALARKHARLHHVPLSWVLAVIYAESGGVQGAVSPVGAVGLMQIMPASHPDCGTKQQLLADPDRNILCGTKYLAWALQRGNDLPRSASIYNAGPSAKTGGPKKNPAAPWGLAENEGYIARVVRANNSFAAMGINRGSPWAGMFVAVLGAAATAILEVARRRRG
ncbi:MAG: lytic transglycosylase domain-containing protein [Gemmatimonadales bacterium]|nr:lytic transglycosylase domain-containing protein [Gemmatimonadales bacterium]